MKSNIILLLTALSTIILASESRSLTLDEAIVISKSRSLRMEGPRIDRDKVEGQISEAWSNALPQADALASYQRYLKTPIMGTDNVGYAEATVTQPIYTFGRIGAGLRAAYSTRAANGHLASSTEKSLELDVMQGFWSVLLLRDVYAVRKEALSLAESALDRVVKLRDVGLLSDYDVLRARAQVSSLVAPMHQAENDLQLADIALKNLLGVPLDTAFTVEGNLTQFDISVEDDLSNSTIASRDDIEALRDVTRVYENGYAIYKNTGWPTIGAQAKYTWAWGSNNWTVDKNNRYSTVSAGISMMIPLWSSGKNPGKAEQMKADWRKSKLNLQEAERGVRLQVIQSRNNYNTAVISEEAAAVAVAQAEEARKIAETRLENGQITQFEIQSAQLDETAAKLSLVGAQYARLVAAAQLRNALGQSPYKKSN